MNETEDMEEQINTLEFDNHGLKIRFPNLGIAISLEPWGNGHHRWYIKENGAHYLISRERLDSFFNHRNFIDGIHTLWKSVHMIATRELDKAEIIANNLEKEVYDKTNRRINKLLRRSGNPQMVPDAIKDIPGIKALEFDMMEAIVYFLVHNEKVTYVGQTTSEWPSRIRQHLKDQKVFDQVYYMHVPEGQVDFWENYYIYKLKPKYNKAMRFDSRFLDIDSQGIK